MPDLLTHVVAGYGLQRGLWPRLSAWFLVGAVLPDILTRPFTIIWPGSFWWTMPLHTPIGLLLVCAAIAFLHAPGRRRSVFLNLGAGASLHVLLDLFQAHLAGSYYLFFPFSWRSVEVDLMWPETSLYLLPVWIALGVWLFVREVRRKSRVRRVSFWSAAAEGLRCFTRSPGDAALAPRGAEDGQGSNVGRWIRGLRFPHERSISSHPPLRGEPKRRRQDSW